MEFSPELIEERYASLPPDVKKAVDSADIGMKVSEIAKGFGLHIDQTGVLDEEIIFVMLGLRKMADFQGKIQSRLGMDDETVTRLAQEINDKVFLTIKESLVQSSQSSNENNREEILEEIENPTPVEHPISLAKAVPAFPMAQEIVPEKVPEKTKEAVAHDFITERLTNTVNLPQQTAEVSHDKSAEKPKNYAADPYREPLV